MSAEKGKSAYGFGLLMVILGAILISLGILPWIFTPFEGPVENNDYWDLLQLLGAYGFIFGGAAVYIYRVIEMIRYAKSLPKR